MRTIYLDADYKCHTSNDGTMREIKVSFFDGKCDAFIEGHRYVPEDETWMREDGIAFAGEMIAPWKDYSELYIVQLLVDYESALAEIETALGV